MSGIRMKNKSWHSLQLAAVTSWLLLLDFHFLNVYFFSEAETAIQPGIKYVCRPLGNMHTVATISKSLLLTHNLHVERFPIWALQSELWTSIIINNNNLIIIFSTGMNLTIRCIPSTFYYTCVVFLKFYNCKFLVDLKKKKKGLTTSIMSVVNCSLWWLYIPVWILTGTMPGVAQEYPSFPSWSVMSLLVTYSILICSAKRDLLAQDMPTAAL